MTISSCGVVRVPWSGSALPQRCLAVLRQRVAQPCGRDPGWPQTTARAVGVRAGAPVSAQDVRNWTRTPRRPTSMRCAAS